jgi:hypothetical protein
VTKRSNGAGSVAASPMAGADINVTDRIEQRSPSAAEASRQGKTHASLLDGRAIQQGGFLMRRAYALGLAVFLAASPAMAQVVIGGDNDSARHDQRAMQDRAQARQDSAEARERAAVGDYRGAAREQNEARHEWRNANREDRKADRDDRGGVTVQLGR